MQGLIRALDHQPRIVNQIHGYIERNSLRVVAPAGDSTALGTVRPELNDPVMIGLSISVMDGMDDCRALWRRLE